MSNKKGAARWAAGLILALSCCGAATAQTCWGNGMREGLYRLSAPALPALLSPGQYAYLAEQQDTNSSGSEALAGHLFATPVSATGALQTPVWDAAALMTLAQRQQSLYTQNASGQLVLLNAVAGNINLLPASIASQMQSNGANAVSALINPDAQGGAWLAGRDPASMMGRPMMSAPVLANTQPGQESVVVVGDEDGFLYGFDAKSGQLLWGFIPPEMLPSTQTAGALVGTNPWGQAASVVSTNASGAATTTVVATAMQGAIHLGLTLNTDGTLASVAWKDFESGQSSPNHPAGGAAPASAIDQTGSAAGKVAYVVGSTLVTRKAADGSGATLTALSTTPTSDALYINDTTAYYGDSGGYVRGALGAADLGSLGESPTRHVIYLTGAFVAGGGSGGTPSWVALAASRDKAVAFGVSASGASALWQFSAASTAGVPTLPSNGLITAMPTVYNAMVFIPVTIGTNACSQTGDEIGPLSLLTGQPMNAQSSYNGAGMGSAITPLGAGEAVFAPASMIGGVPFVFATSDVQGSSSATAGSGAFSLLANAAGGLNVRVDWRELTSFVVSWAQGVSDWLPGGAKNGAAGRPSADPAMASADTTL
jgi:hypothetical protein